MQYSMYIFLTPHAKKGVLSMAFLEKWKVFDVFFCMKLSLSLCNTHISTCF